jgi:hypothetical protein
MVCWPHHPVQNISNDTFGPLVAYLLPGATALAGLSPFLPAVRTWLAAAPGDAPTIGGFLYLTVAALAAGMTVSAVRWLVVDGLHARTGLPPPALDYSRLGENVGAFRLLIDIHYTYYRFYANMLVALAVAWAGYRAGLGWAAPPGLPDFAVFVLAPVFFATSRDNLRKYYARSAQLLQPRPTPSGGPAPAGRRTPAGPRRGRPARSAAG